MNVEEVAKLLHYSPGHVKRLAREGKLPAKKVQFKQVVTVTRYEFPDNLLERIDYEPYAVRRKPKNED